MGDDNLVVRVLVFPPPVQRLQEQAGSRIQICRALALRETVVKLAEKFFFFMELSCLRLVKVAKILFADVNILGPINFVLTTPGLGNAEQCLFSSDVGRCHKFDRLVTDNAFKHLARLQSLFSPLFCQVQQMVRHLVGNLSVLIAL